MKKPETLRKHLEASIPHLLKHPDHLHIYIEDGAVASKPGVSLSFEWRYKLTLLFTDFVDSPDTIVVPLLVWIATNQPDLLADAEKRYRLLTFKSEVISNTAIDIAFELDLTERVIVRATAAGFDCEHADEPQPLYPDDEIWDWEIYLKGELIGQYQATP